MEETEKYAITSLDNFEAYTVEGNELYLNDIDVSKLKKGDKFVLAWEGDSKIITVGEIN